MLRQILVFFIATIFKHEKDCLIQYSFVSFCTVKNMEFLSLLSSANSVLRRMQLDYQMMNNANLIYDKM